MEKVKELVKLREENNYKYDIEVDGGVNPETIKTCFASGAKCNCSRFCRFRSKGYFLQE